MQSRYYDPAIGRFINADTLVSTGQGLLGNNMFAYCLNNPVNCYDSSGTSAVSYCNGDRNPLFIGYYGCGGGGGGGSYNGYSGGGNSQYEDIFEELDAGIEKFLNAVGSFAEACWDAYMRWYNLEQEAVMLQAQMNVDMFDSPEDIERSIDIIEATVGFSVASYKIAVIIMSPTPVSVKAVSIAVGGLIWGIRELCRACQ